MAAGEAAAKEPLVVAAEVESGLLIFTMYLVALDYYKTTATAVLSFKLALIDLVGPSITPP